MRLGHESSPYRERLCDEKGDTRDVRAFHERDMVAGRVVNERFPAPAVSRLLGGPRFDVLTSRAVADAGRIAAGARPVLTRGATALLWTSEPLLGDLREALPGASIEFRRSPGAERRGLARVERFT